VRFEVFTAVKIQTSFCEIWSFHGGENSNQCHLGFDAVLCWARMSTFRGTMLPLSSGWRPQDPLKRWYPTTTLHGVTTQKDFKLNFYPYMSNIRHALHESKAWLILIGLEDVEIW